MSGTAGGYTWAAATVGSESAAPLQLATGQPIMSIGGFNGTDPAPTLAEFERLVAEHKIHYFVGANADSFGGGSGGARDHAWVSAHFTVPDRRRRHRLQPDTATGLAPPRSAGLDIRRSRDRGSSPAE